jgi:hypothetical protein
MAAKNMNRREFIRTAGIYTTAGLAVVGSGALLAGCGGEEKAAEMGSQPKQTLDAVKSALDPCSDVSGLTPAELQTRETFKYVAFEENVEKHCTTCHFWIPAKGDTPCGTCTLVKGPIHPNGGCMSWAAKVES